MEIPPAAKGNSRLINPGRTRQEGGRTRKKQSWVYLGVLLLRAAMDGDKVLRAFGISGLVFWGLLALEQWGISTESWIGHLKALLVPRAGNLTLSQPGLGKRWDVRKE